MSRYTLFEVVRFSLFKSSSLGGGNDGGGVARMSFLPKSERKKHNVNRYTIKESETEEIHCSIYLKKTFVKCYNTFNIKRDI